MADLYSVLPGIQPTQQEILEAELLSKQILEAQFPNMDLREGTGLRDLVIRPTATLLAMIKKATDYYFTQNDLLSVDNTTPVATVDSIMSNLFIQRKIGTLSTISARLFFARAKNTSLTPSTFFSTDNVSKFYPSASLTIPSTSMTLDSYSNSYYVDIVLVAEKEGPTYNISSGSLLYFSSFDPYFLRAEVNYLITSSMPTESNTDFVIRAKSAVSTRNLINTPSIDFNIRDTFNYVSQVVSIGKGDPEMLRDTVLAVLPATVPAQITSIVMSGTLATATLAGHGFHTGQIVILSGASVNDFNTSFVITVTGLSTFTFVVSTSPSAPVTLPTVRSSDAPVRTHIGGCTDVYCSNTVATNVTQVTTDAFGNATLTGPVFSLSRSQISGGGSADTVPFQNNISVIAANVGTTLNYTTGNTLYTLSMTGHPFTVGEAIVVSGFLQRQVLTTITCMGITVTATATGHAYLVGDNVTIAGVSPTSYNGVFTITAVTTNTFTFVVLANIAVSGVCTGATCEVNTINGNFTVLQTTTNSISYLTRNYNAATTGTGLVDSPVKYTVYNPNTETRSVLSVSKNFTTGDVNINLPKHGYASSRRVTLSGITPIGYNGGWVIKSVTDQDNFVVSVPPMISSQTALTGSTIRCSSVIPNLDYGFSTNQQLTVSFGLTYANSTASFGTSFLQNLDSIQAYLINPATRVICGDYLARGFNIYALDFGVVSYQLGGVNASIVSTAINLYIASLQPGDPFIVTELIAIMRAKGVMDIKLPMTIGYKRYTRELDYYVYPDTGNITDVLSPNDRTNMFIVNSISVTAEALPNLMIPVIR